MKGIRIGLCMAGFVLVGAGVATADELPGDHGGILSVQSDNDGLLMDRNSRGYAHGERANYTFGKSEEPAWLHSLISWAPVGYDDRRYSLTAGRTIFSPGENGTVLRPHASYHFLGVGMSGQGSSVTDLVQLQVGLVGDKGAGPVPEDRRSLSEQPSVLLQHTRLWTGEDGAFMGGDIWDLTPHSTISLGTVSTHFATGAMLRVGNAIWRENAALPTFQPNMVVHDRFRAEPGFGINLVAGIEARAVAHDIFLDGGLFGGGPNIDKKWLTGHAFAGVVAYQGRLKAAAYIVKRAKEFSGQGKRHTYGTLTVSWHF